MDFEKLTKWTFIISGKYRIKYIFYLSSCKRLCLQCYSVQKAKFYCKQAYQMEDHFRKWNCIVENHLTGICPSALWTSSPFDLSTDFRNIVNTKSFLAWSKVKQRPVLKGFQFSIKKWTNLLQVTEKDFIIHEKEKLNIYLSDFLNYFFLFLSTLNQI